MQNILYIILDEEKKFYVYEVLESNKTFLQIRRLGDFKTKKIKHNEIYVVIDPKDKEWKIVSALNNKNNIERSLCRCILYNPDNNSFFPEDYSGDINVNEYLSKIQEAVDSGRINHTEIKSIIEDDFSKDFKSLNVEQEEQEELSKQSTIESTQEEYTPNENDSLNKLILHKETYDLINQSLAKMSLGEELSTLWGFDNFKNKDKIIFNFFGPPGTGKTSAAKGIAFQLNKNMVQVDFSSLISKYVGDTGKNIKKYFELAQKNENILLFDEADTILQSRQNVTEHHLVQNINIFMQELDKFKGIVILTTNNFTHYDGALLRRMENIPFELPDYTMKVDLYKKYIPKKLPIKNINFDLLAEKSINFSGADVASVIEKTILSKISVEKTMEKITFNENDFLIEIDKILKTKRNHNGEKSQKIGLA